MAPSTRDEELIARALAGESEPFLLLMRRHQEGIHRFLRGMTSDADSADELTRRSFLRLYRNLHLYREERPLRPWLYKTAANLALTRLRRLRAEAPSSSHGDTPAGLATAPPPAQRAVLILRSALDFDYAGIALILGVPEETVMERLREARRSSLKASARPLEGCRGPLAGMLDAFEDGELARADRRKVDGHLAECSACRETLEGVCALSAELRTETLLSDPGPAYFEDLPQRLARDHPLQTLRGLWFESDRPRSTGRTLLPWIVLPALLILLAVLIRRW